MTPGSGMAGRERYAWFFRPIALLAAAYILIAVTHEWAHALTAYALGVPFTLFHFAVNLERGRGTLTERAAIAAAGPLCSLMIGLICWFAYRRASGSRAELPLLYLATLGGATFFGNLMSSAFVGDFSRVALALRLPAAARYAASVVGLLSLCGLIFKAGWELRRLAPAGSSTPRAMLGMVVLPAAAGTAVVTLASLPMPAPLLSARLAEASFWAFGAAGLSVSRGAPSGGVRTLRPGWDDAAALAAAVLAVRVMARGIAFQQ